MRMNLLIALLTMTILVFNAAALSLSEERDIKSRTMSLLGRTDSIYASDVNIGTDNSLDIEIEAMAPNFYEADAAKILFSAITNTAGAYILAVNKYPEITDLHLIIAGDNWEPVGTLYCQRNWVDQVRTNPDGSYNENDLASLVIKMLGTMSKL
jgi:hypothetical protein